MSTINDYDKNFENLRLLDTFMNKFKVNLYT